MFIGQLILFMIDELECFGGVCQVKQKICTGMITSTRFFPDLQFFDIVSGKLYVASVEDIASVEYLN